MFLYIIRHGEPDYKNDSLTELGKLQAEAVAKRLQKSKINAVYASCMGRAIQTAEPTCRLLGLECHTEEWAHEINGEELTAYPDGELRSLTLLQTTLLRENGEMDIPFDRMFESKAIAGSKIQGPFNYIRDNGRKFLERLGYKEENGLYRIIRPNDDRVALFCHAISSRLWLSELLHIPLHMMWSTFTAHFHTGVTVLEFKNYENGLTSPKCYTYNDTSHLYSEGFEVKHPRSSII